MQVEAKYAKGGTLSADFEQVTESKTLNRVKKSRGRLSMRQPGSVRWETTAPEPSTLVSDGKTYWLYTPPFDAGENGQVIEKPASQIHNQLANSILAGTVSKNPNLKVKALSKNQFEILPQKSVGGTVRRAVVEVDAREQVIRKLTLEHIDGNRAEITLSKVEVGTPFKPDFFSFIPPPNTDRVRD